MKEFPEGSESAAGAFGLRHIEGKFENLKDWQIIDFLLLCYNVLL